MHLSSLDNCRNKLKLQLYSCVERIRFFDDVRRSLSELILAGLVVRLPVLYRQWLGAGRFAVRYYGIFENNELRVLSFSDISSQLMP